MWHVDVSLHPLLVCGDAIVIGRLMSRCGTCFFFRGKNKKLEVKVTAVTVREMSGKQERRSALTAVALCLHRHLDSTLILKMHSLTYAQPLYY